MQVLCLLKLDTLINCYMATTKDEIKFEEYGAVEGIGQEYMFGQFRPIIDITPSWYHKMFLPFVRTRTYYGEGWVKYKQLFGKTFVIDVNNDNRYDSPYVIDPKSMKLTGEDKKRISGRIEIRGAETIVLWRFTKIESPKPGDLVFVCNKNDERSKLKTWRSGDEVFYSYWIHAKLPEPPED